MPTSRISKSCDECHSRKVRCVVPSVPSGAPVVCTNCTRRNTTCQFRDVKARPARKAVKLDAPAPLTGLFIDRLIQDPSARAPLYDEFSVLRVDDRRGTSPCGDHAQNPSTDYIHPVPSSGLAFFSDRKINSLVERLGSAEIRNLVHQIDNAIRLRLLASSHSDTFPADLARPPTVETLPSPEVESYVKSYFQSVHPVFPFLDRADFEGKANDPHLVHILNTDSAFCALFHAVMALGCQYHGCGSFQPGFGKAWKLFQTSLTCVARVTTSRDSLSKLQALIAMAIFAMNASCLQIDNFLLAEATRTVLALRYHKSSLSDANADVCYRAFWVVYHMEKQYNFQARSSSAIIDNDVGCQIPPAPESMVNGYDWFIASIRISRIFSITYDSFFSVTASTRSAASLLPAVNHIQKLLEDWRQSIPPAYRPRETLQRSVLTDMGTREIVIRTHFYYFHLVMALERMKLHLSSERRTTEDSLRTLLNAAGTVVELTRFIDVEPYTPVFVLAIMPLSALFILFDFVIHNPAHPDTRQNLTFLDILSGHFSVIEHASRGSLPGNYLSRFGNMARQYAENLSNQLSDSMGTDASVFVREGQDSRNSLPRTDTTFHDDIGVSRATTSNSRNEFDQDPLTGFDTDCNFSRDSALLCRTDTWPAPLQIEHEAGLGALFGSAISWEGLID
ncbi:hypothetical protein BDV24DRAFT_166916 [Aspergillus arachidicola]|uniref:Zn(2)-C6 fungal-type domain-containing protein n=1 Tax=Aspergillus arachidicola TaxID=656916 RepID=A0A5N6XXF4_9EURO|nr:hypothetical protein BDV24DRAFT_166916 [Aspergillus arachidicola]